MRFPVLLSVFFLASSSVVAQAPDRSKSLGSWDIEYDRTVSRRHAESVHSRDRGRMVVRSVGDSLLGQLVIGDSATGQRLALTGTARGNAWTFFADDPDPRGMAIFFSALEAAMDWLRESIHGVQPTIVRFDVVVRGDSLVGTRTVTGFGVRGANAVEVRGRRAPSHP